MCHLKLESSPGLMLSEPVPSELVLSSELESSELVSSPELESSSELSPIFLFFVFCLLSSSEISSSDFLFLFLRLTSSSELGEYLLDSESNDPDRNRSSVKVRPGMLPLI